MTEIDPAITVATNLRSIIGHAGLSARGWALRHHLDPKMVQRVLKRSHSPTLETLADLAAAARLTVWQLLIPRLDPTNPPVVTMTEAEREMYARIRADFDKLPPLTGKQ